MQTEWKSHSPKITIGNSFLFILPKTFIAFESTDLSLYTSLLNKNELIFALHYVFFPQYFC